MTPESDLFNKKEEKQGDTMIGKLIRENRRCDEKFVILMVKLKREDYDSDFIGMNVDDFIYLKKADLSKILELKGTWPEDEYESEFYVPHDASDKIKGLLNLSLRGRIKLDERIEYSGYVKTPHP
jgi:hypothetical protein